MEKTCAAEKNTDTMWVEKKVKKGWKYSEQKRAI